MLSLPGRSLHRHSLRRLSCVSVGLASLVLIATTALSQTTSRISGQAVNGVSGLPISRVLIRCGSESMLTDGEGRFQCGADGSTVSITAMKPGYYAALDPNDFGSTTVSAPYSSSPVQVPLYPEAVLSGSLTSQSGEPLPNVMVQARRLVYEESGHRWEPGTPVRTDSRGEFRLPVQPGDYSVRSLYSAGNSGHPQAILPLCLPEGSAFSGAHLIHALPGETQHFDMQAMSLPTVSARLILDPEGNRGGPRIFAYTADGSQFPLRSSGGADAGGRTVDLPRGSYVLYARRQGANGTEEAETRVTAADNDLSGVVLRFSQDGLVTVEMQADPAGTTITPPTIAQLGLYLEATDGSPAFEEPTQHLESREGQGSFFSPPAGSYRLRARGSGQWFVRSATLGTSDLLRQDLVITPGAGAASVRILVSSQTAGISGVVRKSGQPAAGWIYLVCTTPSASPLQILHANADGKYVRSFIPPGSYRAIAFEHRHSINFEDPAQLAALSNEMRSVSVAPGDKGTLDLEIAPDREAR